MSRSFFADRFARTIGVTPLNYLLQWRLALPIDQSPDLFPDEITRELLGAHVKRVAISA